MRQLVSHSENGKYRVDLLWKESHYKPQFEKGRKRAGEEQVGYCEDGCYLWAFGKESRAGKGADNLLYVTVEGY